MPIKTKVSAAEKVWLAALRSKLWKKHQLLFCATRYIARPKPASVEKDFLPLPAERFESAA